MDDDACQLIAQTRYNGEPYAARIDVTQAGIALEMARHAPDPGITVTLLSQTAQWLRWAQSNYTQMDAPGSPRAERAGCVAAQIESYAAGVNSWGDLATFQNTQLLQAQGALRELENDALSLQGRDSSLNFFAVLGLVVTVYGVAVYEYHKAHPQG